MNAYAAACCCSETPSCCGGWATMDYSMTRTVQYQGESEVISQASIFNPDLGDRITTLTVAGTWRLNVSGTVKYKCTGSAGAYVFRAAGLGLEFEQPEPQLELSGSSSKVNTVEFTNDSAGDDSLTLVNKSASNARIKEPFEPGGLVSAGFGNQGQYCLQDPADVYRRRATYGFDFDYDYTNSVFPGVGTDDDRLSFFNFLVIGPEEDECSPDSEPMDAVQAESSNFRLDFGVSTTLTGVTNWVNLADADPNVDDCWRYKNVEFTVSENIDIQNPDEIFNKSVTVIYEATYSNQVSFDNFTLYDEEPEI